MELTQITLDDFYNFTIPYIAAGNTQPILLWGPYGAAKSSGVRELQSRLNDPEIQAQFGLKGSYNLLDVRLSQFDAVDTRGIPYESDGKTTWLHPDWLPDPEIHGEFGILFLDELLLAAKGVQNAAYQLLQERQLGDYTLPPGWFVLAASNRPEDGAGLTGAKFDAAISNRFACHYSILPDPKQWIAWASKAGISPEIIAFISAFGEATLNENGETDQAGLLHEYPDGGVPKGKVSIATPRTWESASNILKLGLDPRLESLALESCVGKGSASQLSGFLQIVRTLPPASQIFNDPDNAPIPSERSTQYAIATILANKADESSFGAALKYLQRVSGELESVCVIIATNRNKNLLNTQAYGDWKIRHQAESI